MVVGLNGVILDHAAVNVGSAPEAEVEHVQIQNPKMAEKIVMAALEEEQHRRGSKLKAVMALNVQVTNKRILEYIAHHI